MNAPETPLKGYKSLQSMRVVADTNIRSNNRLHFVTPPPLTEKVSGTTGHFRTYRPRPFTREERAGTTILFGGLHWRVERVLQGMLSNLGYTSEILPAATREDMLTGREVADFGQCCPTSFTTGNLANYLRGMAQRIGAEQLAKDYIYVTASGRAQFGGRAALRSWLTAILKNKIVDLIRHPEKLRF